jgi:hypothetical protein
MLLQRVNKGESVMGVIHKRTSPTGQMTLVTSLARPTLGGVRGAEREEVGTNEGSKTGVLYQSESGKMQRM